MTDLSYWLVFLAAAFVFNISPGPDWVYIVSRTLARGRQVGFGAAAGVCAGAMVHVTAAALGVSALLATSAVAFTVVKWAGGAYLLYLGVQAWRSPGTSFQLQPAPELQEATKTQASTGVSAPVAVRVSVRVSSQPSISSFWPAFRQGMLVDVLNPKVALFFMAFLPQFVRPAHGSAASQLMLLGTIVVAMALCLELLLVVAAARAIGYLQVHPAVSRWLERLMGTVLVGLGLRLLVARPQH